MLKIKGTKLGQKIAFVGLGVMGYPMAGHCKKAGHEVTVFNRTTQKAEAWVNEFSGSMALSPKLAAKQANVILLCVGNDDDLRSVMLGEQGVLAGVNSGDIIVDHTTASAEVAREMAVLCTNLGVGFLDAPVSGGQVGAENGQLTVMLGGHQTDYNDESNLYCGHCTRIGRSAQFWRKRRIRLSCSHRCDFKRCCSVLANGKSF